MPNSYPSPPPVQSAPGAGPFYTPSTASVNATTSAPIPVDLQRLQDAHYEPTADEAEHMEQAMGVPQEYTSADPQRVSEHEGLRDELHPSPERLAQGVLSMNDHGMDDQAQHMMAAAMGEHAQGSFGDSGKRRSKVSRACDECRRKKIRCDASLDIPDEPCSNCRRTQSYCAFSRQPLKRGPSKGYIKELADRLNSLESQMGVPHTQQTQQPGLALPPEAEQLGGGNTEGFSGSNTPTHAARKRKLPDHQGYPYGREEGYMAARQGADWSAQQLRAAPQADMTMPSSINETFNTSAYPPHPAQPSSSGVGAPARPGVTNNNRRDTVGLPFEGESRETEVASLPDWDEGIVDEYYRLIHQTFPLLPHSKARLRSRLAKCPPTLREAFSLAIDTAIRTSPSSNVQGMTDWAKSTQRASELIASSQFEPTSSRTMSTSLIYIQTLILMALESDNHGPATMRGQMGPPRGEWLGRAIGMAVHLKLNSLHPRDRFGEGDPDSDEKLGRRIWWILFILDRWHASSTSSLLQLPDNSSTLMLEDQIMLGESTYHLTRLSYILGHLSTILQQPPSLMSATSTAAPIITTAIVGEVDRFRESVESLLLGAPNLVHLSYWHVRLLTLRLTASTMPHELLVPASRMASTLNSSYTMITPLNHHFAALAALTLVELCDFEETREGASKGIEDIIEALGAKRGLMSREDSTGWDSAIRELVVARRGRGTGSGGEEGTGTVGLQHLADAAVGGTNRSGSPGEASTGSLYDPTLMTRYGYLAALVQESGP